MKLLKVIRPYFDILLQRKTSLNEVIEVDEKRATDLLANENLIVEDAGTREPQKVEPLDIDLSKIEKKKTTKAKKATVRKPRTKKAK
jgi:hypothetical protein